MQLRRASAGKLRLPEGRKNIAAIDAYWETKIDVALPRSFTGN
jgi:hypothetical protein